MIFVYEKTILRFLMFFCHESLVVTFWLSYFSYELLVKHMINSHLCLGFLLFLFYKFIIFFFVGLMTIVTIDTTQPTQPSLGRNLFHRYIPKLAPSGRSGDTPRTQPGCP